MREPKAFKRDLVGPTQLQIANLELIKYIVREY